MRLKTKTRTGVDLSNLPIDGYIRVSIVGDRSGDSYISPDVQAKAIEKLAREKGLRLRLNPPEENESGGTMDRPIFNEVMARIRNGESGGVVVYTLDRFARTLVGGYTLLTEIAERGAVFASATEAQFDFTTSSGRLMLQMHLMMAEYFRERSKEAWRAAAESAVVRGIHPAPYGAFGYDRLDRRLVRNADAPFALEAYRLRVEDRSSYEAIADWLNGEGRLNTLIDGEGALHHRPWTGPAVRRMMQRRVYLGEAFYGAEQNTTGADAAINPNAHEAIVPEHLWLAAQEAVHSFSKKRSADAPDGLLHGLLRCAGCRYLMSAGKSGGVRCYRCRRTFVSGKCPSPTGVKADRVEEYVERLVCEELDKRRAVTRGLSDAGELPQVQARLAQARRDLDEFRRDTDARRRLGKRFLEFLEPLLADVEDAEREVAEVTGRLLSGVEALTSALYLNLSRSDRRVVLGQVVDAVFVRSIPGLPRGRHTPPLSADQVLVFWRGEGPRDLPVKSRFAEGGISSFDWPIEEHEAQPRVVALENAPQRAEAGV